MKYLPLILALACTPALQNTMDKLADASSVICDSLDAYNRYDETILSIKDKIKVKEYKTALVEALALLERVEKNGDVDALPEVKSLVTLLEKLAKVIEA